MLPIRDLVSLEKGPWSIKKYTTESNYFHLTFEFEQADLTGSLFVDVTYRDDTSDVFIRHNAINLPKTCQNPLLQEVKTLIEQHPSFRLLAVTTDEFVKIEDRVQSKSDELPDLFHDFPF